MGHPTRPFRAIAIAALVPLLLAVVVLFPAAADTPAEVVNDVPSVTVPAEEDEPFDVGIDTGTVVNLNATVLSAKAVTATAPAGPKASRNLD